MKNVPQTAEMSYAGVPDLLATREMLSRRAGSWQWSTHRCCKRLWVANWSNGKIIRSIDLQWRWCRLSAGGNEQECRESVVSSLLLLASPLLFEPKEWSWNGKNKFNFDLSNPWPQTMQCWGITSTEPVEWGTNSLINPLEDPKFRLVLLDYFTPFYSTSSQACPIWGILFCVIAIQLCQSKVGDNTYFLQNQAGSA